jgi:membrane associated rhomboid family serine protease
VSWQAASVPTPERRRSPARVAFWGVFAFVALLYLVEALDVLSGGQLERSYGVEPREVHGLDGVLFAPVLHGGWDHLLANTLPLLIFGFLLFLAGVPRWLAVTGLVWVIGGLGTWLTGGEGSVHVGASVLAFGWLTYLLLRGVFSRRPEQLGLAAILLVLYGGLLFGVLPGQPGISWQGHLFGAIGGAVAAWTFGRVDRANHPSR